MTTTNEQQEKLNRAETRNKFLEGKVSRLEALVKGTAEERFQTAISQRNYWRAQYQAEANENVGICMALGIVPDEPDATLNAAAVKAKFQAIEQNRDEARAMCRSLRAEGGWEKSWPLPWEGTKEPA